MSLRSYRAIALEVCRQPLQRSKQGGFSAHLIDGFALLLSLWITFHVAGAGASSPNGDIDSATPETMQTARAHVAAGKARYQRGEYEAAQKEFEKAYSLLPLPELLRSLAQTADKQGRFDDAIRYGESYLTTGPVDSDAAEMIRYLTDLRARRPTSPPAALLDGRMKPPSPHQPRLGPPLALVGTGLGLLAIGGGLGLGALNTQQWINDALSSGHVYYPDIQSAYDRGSGLNLGAITVDVIGGLCLAGGLAWMGNVIYRRRNHTQEPGIQGELSTGTAR